MTILERGLSNQVYSNVYDTDVLISWWRTAHCCGTAACGVLHRYVAQVLRALLEATQSRGAVGTWKASGEFHDCDRRKAVSQHKKRHFNRVSRV